MGINEQAQADAELMCAKMVVGIHKLVGAKAAVILVNAAATEAIDKHDFIEAAERLSDILAGITAAQEVLHGRQ